MKKITLVLALFTLISYSQTQRLDKISFKDLDDSDNWTETSKMEFTYNADNIFIGEVISDIDDTGNWIVTYERNLTLDADNKVVQVDLIEEDFTSKKEISYNTNGTIDEIIYSDLNSNTNQYQNFEKLKYFYDENNLKTEAISYTINNSQWIEDEKTTYLYNANNQLETTYLYDYLEDIDEWETQANEKTIYSYNANQKLSTKIVYDFLNDWSEEEKEEYSYDEYQNLIETTYSYWDNSWIEDGQEVYTDYDNNYNFNDLILPIFEIEEQDEINLFFNHKLNHFDYYYDGEVEGKTDLIYSDITASTNDISKEVLNIYPNPFTNEISFTLTTQKNMTINLFDIQGKIILNKTITNGEKIDLSTLDNGVYFYDLTSENKNIKGKIIKQ